MKENLLVSFSGGETSAYMTWWIWKNWRDRYNVRVIFANTGDENFATLLFVYWFECHFNIPVTWLEAKVYHGQRKGTGFEVVDFYNCSRNGEPFEEVVKKYGIPNQENKHCTRELKQAPIHAYAKLQLGWNKYKTAIGIRIDEFDRVSSKRKEFGLLYPLISDRPMNKQKINFWWSMQPFRLFLKGYQGNCKACHKKSLPKLYQIAIETPLAFYVTARLERKYEAFTSESRKRLLKKRGKLTTGIWRFYRGNRTVADIKREAMDWKGKIKDDSLSTSYQDSLDFSDYENESCEVFSTCGVDN